MPSQNYYYKGRDLVKLRGFLFNLVLTLTLTIVCLLVIFISPGITLDWEDKEWTSPGCPETVLGIWTADNPENSGYKNLSINDRGLVYTLPDNQAQEYKIARDSFSSGKRYVSMQLIPLKKEHGEEKYLKIRPHLVQAGKKKNDRPSSCLIKIFDFKTKRHAQMDRYSGWNIFRYSSE
tara:strand:+ start:31 stop:564 length:534 start_codon:yes stop_codon:yes gene_type:complete